MAQKEKPKLGAVAWRDLTVPEAEKIRDFYTQVAGWEPAPLSMGDYDDYCMNRPGTTETVAGICHARGVNAKLPPQWLIYVQVADVQASVAQAEALGGRVVDGPRSMAGQQFCVIQDPAGAVFAIIGE